MSLKDNKELYMQMVTNFDFKNNDDLYRDFDQIKNKNKLKMQDLKLRHVSNKLSSNPEIVNLLT